VSHQLDRGAHHLGGDHCQTRRHRLVDHQCPRLVFAGQHQHVTLAVARGGLLELHKPEKQYAVLQWLRHHLCQGFTLVTQADQYQVPLGSLIGHLHERLQ